jgi:predicted nucleotidyltransferase
MREVLFKTVHGSRLYGLSHAGSDEDFYTVVTKTPVDDRYNRQTKARYAKQKITGSEDSFVVDFGTWIEMCKSGVPQALEAMFSQMPIEDRIGEFRASFRTGPVVMDKYLKTIKSFALAEDDTIKKRRHALRLALNMRELAETGRFNPTLSQEDANWITSMSSKTHEDVYGLALVTAWAPL